MRLSSVFPCLCDWLPRIRSWCDQQAKSSRFLRSSWEIPLSTCAITLYRVPRVANEAGLVRQTLVHLLQEGGAAQAGRVLLQCDLKTWQTTLYLPAARQLVMNPWVLRTVQAHWAAAPKRHLQGELPVSQTCLSPVLNLTCHPGRCILLLVC